MTNLVNSIAKINRSGIEGINKLVKLGQRGETLLILGRRMKTMAHMQMSAFDAFFFKFFLPTLD